MKVYQVDTLILTWVHGFLGKRFVPRREEHEKIIIFSFRSFFYIFQSKDFEKN